MDSNGFPPLTTRNRTFPCWNSFLNHTEPLNLPPEPVRHEQFKPCWHEGRDAVGRRPKQRCTAQSTRTRSVAFGISELFPALAVTQNTAQAPQVPEGRCDLRLPQGRRAPKREVHHHRRDLAPIAAETRCWTTRPQHISQPRRPPAPAALPSPRQGLVVDLQLVLTAGESVRGDICGYYAELRGAGRKETCRGGAGGGELRPQRRGLYLLWPASQTRTRSPAEAAYL